MFELLFKYPRSAYSRGQFALLGAWPKWVLALLIVAVAVALALLIRRRLAQAGPGMRGVGGGGGGGGVGAPKGGWAGLLGVLWGHPATGGADQKPQQNIIAVLVDDSK